MRAVPCGAALARSLLVPILGRRTDAEGRHDLGALVDAGVPWAILDDNGQAVGAFVLQDYGRGLLWITAIAGRADVDMCRVIDRMTVERAQGFREMGFTTERPGLVRKARRLGYQVQRREGAAYFLRKNLQ